MQAWPIYFLWFWWTDPLKFPNRKMTKNRSDVVSRGMSVSEWHLLLSTKPPSLITTGHRPSSVTPFLRSCAGRISRDNLQIKTDDTVNGGELCAEGDALCSTRVELFWCPYKKVTLVQTHLHSASPLRMSEEAVALFLPPAAPLASS